MPESTQVVLADIKVGYKKGKDSDITITLPCGCNVYVLLGSVNQYGEPMQFKGYCKTHFEW